MATPSRAPKQPFHAIHDVGLYEIVSYTSGDNLRSQSVMRKLKLVRDPSRELHDPKSCFSAMARVSLVGSSRVLATLLDVRNGAIAAVVKDAGPKNLSDSTFGLVAGVDVGIVC